MICRYLLSFLAHFTYIFVIFFYGFSLFIVHSVVDVFHRYSQTIIFFVYNVVCYKFSMTGLVKILRKFGCVERL